MQFRADKWLPLENPRMTPEGYWESTVRLDVSSEWFSGHFDEFPVLPGVALLALVAEMLRIQCQEQVRCLKVFGFSKVRFKRLVFPDDELYISLAAMPSENNSVLDFHITFQGKTVVQGLLKVLEEESSEKTF